MDAKLLDDAPGRRAWTLVFDTDDELMETLLAFAREHGVEAAEFTAIGALRAVTLAYFDWEAKEYEEHPLEEQVEVLTLAGNVAVEGGEPQVHAHGTVGLRDTTVRGGHVLRAVVRPTLELFLTEAPGRRLVKRPDAETGLSLIEPDEG